MDTIFQRNGKILLGTIGTVTELNIFFRNEKGINDRIKLSKVAKYVITKKIPKPKIDTMANYTMANYNRDEDLQYMKDCFRRCHKEYSSGVVFTILGVLAMGGGLYYSGNPLSNSNNQSNTAGYLIAAGALSSLIGSMIIMDSHKWIGRAGLVDYGVGISIMNKSSKRPKN